MIPASSVISKPSLKEVCDQDPGYSRHKWGKGFIYKDEKGNKIKDERILKRIKDLVIPPAWEDVWICPHATGHLQCTGKDERQRKQYIYHPKWAEYNRLSNSNNLKKFGKTLPKIRKQIEADLNRKDWPKQKVLALVVHLLDEYYLRIGNKQYYETNNTHGLTTLRRKHIQATKGNLRLCFLAKSNKMRKVEIGNKKLAKLVLEISDFPGYEVFRYKEDNKNYLAVTSHDVNEYIRSMAGEPFSAKDFRTWGGTKLAVENFPRAQKMVEDNPRLHLEPTLVGMVAETLGNTVATCRAYYIHPTVLRTLVDYGLPKNSSKSKGLLEASEKVVLKIMG